MSQNNVLAQLVFARTYSRRKDNRQETYAESLERVINGLSPYLSPSEQEIVKDSFFKQTASPAGRYLWVGGTEWVEKPENFSGVFNCSSLPASSFANLEQAMSLLMQGCGVGLVVEKDVVSQLPKIKNNLNLEIIGEYGAIPKEKRKENTCLIKGNVSKNEPNLLIIGDSRQGWCKAFRYLLELASTKGGDKNVTMDISHVRAAGERIKGFGGVANPDLLEESFPKVARLLNKAKGRKLKPTEVMLIVGTLANLICAGNVRRSAIIFQGSSDDIEFQNCKKDLWIQNEEGKWVIDPERDGYRMANNTRVFHTIPDYEEVHDAVVSQFYSGEGAIQNALESVWRANADIFLAPSDKALFYAIAHKGYLKNFTHTLRDAAQDILFDKAKESYLSSDFKGIFSKGYSLSDFIKENFKAVYGFEVSKEELSHRLRRYALNPCGEVIGTEFHCNLAQVVANKLNPFDINQQIEAFKAASLSASVLLNGSFVFKTMEQSRQFDPIIQITITGLFDFFAVLFGKDWIEWWSKDRNPQFKKITRDSIDIKEIIEVEFSRFSNQTKAYGAEDIFDFEKIIEEDYAYFYKEVEKFYLSFWKDIVNLTVADYCDRHKLKIPNRVTGMQPSGTKSLLTNSSNGIHPSFGKHYIRRVTLQKNEPLALICQKLGFKVVPDPNSKNEKGELLHEDEIYHPDCKNWLVEFPVCPDWVEQIDYSDEYDPGEYSFKAMWDFYSLIQNYWSEHNTSATIYFSENEIDEVAKSIYKGFSDGYISAALMPRYNAIFPRMPFESISEERYEEEMKAIELRKKTSRSFEELLNESNNEAIGPSGCDSDKCLMS